MERITKRIFKTQFKVRELLTERPKLRDDATFLVCCFWNAELKALGHDIKEYNTVNFFTLLTNKTLTSADTITRASRKLQEEYHELRGASWKKRKGIESNVRQEINRI